MTGFCVFFASARAVSRLASHLIREALAPVFSAAPFSTALFSVAAGSVDSPAVARGAAATSGAAATTGAVATLREQPPTATAPLSAHSRSTPGLPPDFQKYFMTILDDCPCNSSSEMREE